MSEREVVDGMMRETHDVVHQVIRSSVLSGQTVVEPMIATAYTMGLETGLVLALTMADDARRLLDAMDVVMSESDPAVIVGERAELLDRYRLIMAAAS